jgi:hypothetical protein
MRPEKIARCGEYLLYESKGRLAVARIEERHESGDSEGWKKSRGWYLYGRVMSDLVD